jgi:hypothetical protein
MVLAVGFLLPFFLAYYKEIDQPRCFTRKVRTAGWCNDYRMLRFMRPIDVVIMKAIFVDKVLHQWR